MNSTLKSLLFWMVLVVVGVLIWNFSTTLQNRDDEISFSQFLQDVREKKVSSVTIEGNDITGSLNGTTGDGKEKFRTYAPTAVPGTRQRAERERRRHQGQAARRPAHGPRCCMPGRRSC